MIRLEMKNCNMLLTEKQQKYQHYCHEYLTDEEILPSDQRKVIEQTCLHVLFLVK